MPAQGPAASPVNGNAPPARSSEKIASAAAAKAECRRPFGSATIRTGSLYLQRRTDFADGQGRHVCSRPHVCIVRNAYAEGKNVAFGLDHNRATTPSLSA